MKRVILDTNIYGEMVLDTDIEALKTSIKLGTIDDFLIVACASAHQIDVVVSEDSKSMLTANALKAYRLLYYLENT